MINCTALGSGAVLVILFQKSCCFLVKSHLSDLMIFQIRTHKIIFQSINDTIPSKRDQPRMSKTETCLPYFPIILNGPRLPRIRPGDIHPAHPTAA